jgi:hypothetical protein
MSEEKSIKDLLIEMNEKIEEKGKREKGFKLPWKGKVSKSKVKKGWATYMVIRDNRNIEFTKKPIEEQTVVIDGTPRIATADDTLFYKGKPFYVQPSWSVKPFSPTENYNQTIKEGYASQGYKLLMNRMKNEQLTTKKSFGGIGIFLIIVAIIAIGYFVIKGM